MVDQGKRFERANDLQGWEVPLFQARQELVARLAGVAQKVPKLL